MGLWGWIFQRLSQSHPGAPQERAASLRSEAGQAAIAVATRPPVPVTNENETELAFWWTPKDGALLDPVEARPEDCQHPYEFLENTLVSYFDGHDLTMPQLNNVAEQILPKLRRDNCDLKTIGREIAVDQILTAAVLRTVNSPMYRGIDQITTVPAAVARIGIKALRAILLQQSVRSAIFARNRLTKHFATALWRRSLGDACIMRGLAGLMRMDQDDCHLIGLMHDIGSVLVLRIINDHITTGYTPIDMDTFEYLRQETHQEFGELVAKAWQLPPELTSLITNHHSYPALDDPLAKHRWMLILTEMIGGMLYSDRAANYDLLQCRPAAALGLSTFLEYQSWLSELPDELNLAMQDSES